MSRSAPVLAPPRRRPDLPVGPGGPRIGSGDRRDAPGDRPRGSAALIAVWLLVGTVTLLFAAITSALLARRTEGDWQIGPLPDVLWLGTAVLVASSLAVEWARRRGRRGEGRVLRAGLGAGALLGVVFLLLQWTAWRQLVAMGVYLAGSPHAGFFYLLTGLHGLHLVGGLAGWGYALTRLGRTAPHMPPAVEPAAVFWHFLTGLWLYLLAILFAL